MDNLNLPFSNYQTPWPGCNPGQPVSGICKIPKEPLNFGISLYCPVSSVPGSASFFFLQPLLTGKVFAAIGILIAAQVFLFIADRFWGLDTMPIQKTEISPDQTVKMSLNDLHDFLASMAQDKQPPNGLSAAGQDIGSITTQTPEIPLVCALTISSAYSNEPFGPAVFFLLPILTFPGARGALPLLILELLTTIFVRSVVPPQSTGSKPLTDPDSKQNSKLLQFTPEDLLNLLNRFSKHFGS